ncbi:HPP family protein [Antrihabitans sp. YC2-6]|uniref:CBS domain-containing protein n=1 Tax=Antrihabitans sp. YC2-6 TaxID=2799498 RepID=UPI0018F2DC18|nr:CBS domain-containing protein [Antrihabitans sp. YC2-6]MBJ8346996.1 CBS domain-containing protein [Antrihabitans sp. YC2-6]
MSLIDFFSEASTSEPAHALDLMSSPIVALAIDVSVADAADAMLRTGFTTLPIVDNDGFLVKLATEDAVAKAYLTQCWAERACSDESGPVDERGTRVMDFASPQVSVTPSASLAEITEAMLRAQLRAIPVVEHGRPVGMVTWRDILATIARPSGSRANTK